MSQYAMYNKNDTDPNWQTNYKYASTSYSALTTASLKSSLVTVRRIKVNIISFNMQDKLKALQQEFVGFVNKLGQLMQASNGEQYQIFNGMLTSFGTQMQPLALTNTNHAEPLISFKELNAEIDIFLNKDAVIVESDANLLLYKISLLLKNT